jgi:hypothetical protein
LGLLFFWLSVVVVVVVVVVDGDELLVSFLVAKKGKEERRKKKKTGRGTDEEGGRAEQIKSVCSLIGWFKDTACISATWLLLSLSLFLRSCPRFSSYNNHSVF